MTTTHQHPSVPFAALLPAVPAQLPAGVDDTARTLLAAVWADCDTCVEDLWRTLEQTQRRETRRQPVDDHRDDGLHLRTVTTDPAAPGALEAVHAYGLLAAAVLIIDQARRAGADPAAHAEGFAAEYALPDGHPFAASAAMALRTIANLVGQAADAEAAAEYAQGVITTGDLMGIDGHALLAQTARLTLIVALTVGMVTATEFDLAAPAPAAPPAQRGEPGVRDEKPTTGTAPRGPGGMEDVTSVSLAQLTIGLTPTITVMPGITPAADAADFRLQQLLDFGFARLDMGSPAHPAGPTGWTVRVDRGHLVSVGSGQVRWWTTDNPPAMPEHWRRAARQARQVLLIVVAPGTYPDAEQVDTAEANRLLRHASASGRVVGGLLPLRGTLS